MRRDDLPSRLTWYPGSVLPFASLWHTLRRVAVLNALRVREVPHGTVTLPSAFCPPPDLLYNEGVNGRPQALSTRELARRLGEPVEIFSWSHLGGIPGSLRFLVHAQLRVCPQCLAAGYHSALLSLRLLERCPSHGCELWDRCPCGRPFERRLGASDLACAGHCRCGKLAFFTRQTVRLPTITAKDIRPLQPVAEWLERLVGIGIPEFLDNRLNTLVAADWLHRVHEWSDALELGVPACFSLPPVQGHMRVASTTTRASALPKHRPGSGLSAVQEHRRPGAYWDDDPATFAFRGMQRHLRRHVARGADRFGREFLSNPDPIRIAERMRTSPAAKAAFAEMLWCERLEPHVMQRRWPYRSADDGPGGRYVGYVEMSHDFRCLDSPQAWRWTEYQACRCLMLSCWRAAQQLATTAVESGVADWRRSRTEDALRWSSVRLEGSIRFVCLEEQTPSDWTLPLPDKSLRRASHDANAALRRRTIEQACAGPCLTHDGVHGWTVNPSLQPSSSRVAGHRLLGLGRERPRFWLFEASGQFVARACDLKLQAVADTPRHAIESLRQAMCRYRALYYVSAVDPDAMQQRVRTEPAADPARLAYERKIGLVFREYGFWDGAELFYAEAMRFQALRVRRQPDQWGDADAPRRRRYDLASRANPEYVIRPARRHAR